MTSLANQIKDKTLILFIPILFLLYWKLSIIIFQIPKWYFPSPEDVISRIINTPTIWYHAQITLIEMFVGFTIAIILGFLSALLISHSKIIENIFYPYVIIMQAIPISAIAPLLVIWFGYGMAPRIIAAAILGYYPIVRTVREGFKAADYRILDFMRSINATKWQIFKKIELNTALPYIFSGLSIAAPLTLIGSTVAEFFGGNRGLGYLVQISTVHFEVDLSLGVVGVLAFIGLASFAIFNWIEKAFFTKKPIIER
jgi:NitT/TauT family transport system permease protein